MVYLWEAQEPLLRSLEKFDFSVFKRLVRTAVDYIINGTTSLKDFDPQFTDANEIRPVIDNLVVFYLECCRGNISPEKLSEFLEGKQFKSEYIGVIIHEYRENKSKIYDLYTESDNLLYYHDMQWRLEAKVASRSLLHQMVPLITMDLKFGDSPVAADTAKFSHEILQTDPGTLLKMADSMEKALNVTRSRDFRKTEKQMKKLASEM